MNTTIATQSPNFHGLTGNQPVGQVQIAVAAEYAGTITSVTRINTAYWAVVTRNVRDAFRGPALAGLGYSARIWFDSSEQAYVVDYWDGDVFANQPTEAGRARSLRAAIGIAADSTAQRWAAAQ